MNRILAQGASLATAMLIAATASFAAVSPARAQKHYKMPEEAVNALVVLARTGDRNAASVIFGGGGEAIASSGDKVADDAARRRFIAAYDAKHHISVENHGKAILVIGAEDYPFPIPLVRNNNGTWSFDTDAGRREILDRRIGRNELATIQDCLAYVDAQNDYASKDRTGAGPGLYAQRFISEPGKKDGLYWPTAQGEEGSPLGPLFAEASRHGYQAGLGHVPYHGYYYKILTSQGPAALGGVADYIVDGKMIGGFALVAYPAQYRSTGVMTFIVDYDGTVFQKDLGSKTSEIAEAMTAFNPDKTWAMVDASAQAK